MFSDVMSSTLLFLDAAIQALSIGPLIRKAVQGVDTVGVAEARLLELRALQKADHEMLVMMLAHIQGAAAQLGLQAGGLLQLPLSALLDINKPFEPQVSSP